MSWLVLERPATAFAMLVEVSVAEVETIAVVDRAGNALVINAADFDPEQHTKPGQKKAGRATIRKPVRRQVGD